jgi:hypothetical protein
MPETDHVPHHPDADILAAGLEHVRQSPADTGTVELLVTRPAVDERVVREAVAVDVDRGLLGDTWVDRVSRRMADGSANPDAQVTVMNARAALLVAGSRDRMPLAGDQVYVDLDLSVDNLPTGTILELGDCALMVTAEPHTGCAKFSARFGVDALRLTATPDGRRLRLRGINTRVVRPGVLHVGDTVTVERPSGDVKQT